jgi:ribulose-phosphate 3-epimerase
MTVSKNQKKFYLAPSILSANFARLGEEVEAVEAAGADWIHVDVMDGHFVPNLTLGPLVVEAIRPLTKLPIDCHLMVSEPEKWIDPFAQAGVNSITIHVEATQHLNRALHQIREAGCRVGVTLNPATPLILLEEVLNQVDLVLIMSVNPGFGGQKFIESSLSKIERLAKMREQSGSSFLIEVDGGVNTGMIRKLRDAGAEVFVAGSAVFSSGDPKKALAELRLQLVEG